LLSRSHLLADRLLTHARTVARTSLAHARTPRFLVTFVLSYGRGRGSCYVEFVRNGWTDKLITALGGVRRQVLHAAVVDFAGVGGGRHSAPLPDDFLAACESRLGITADDVVRLTNEHMARVGASS